MTDPVRISVMGVGGRMGRALAQAVDAHPRCQLDGGTERAGSELIGLDVGHVAGVAETGRTVVDDPLDVIKDTQVILDFTSPDASVAFAELAAQARIVHVIGTTGFSAEQEREIEAAGRHAVIVKAGNMSLGVNLLTELTRRVAKALDADFDIEVVEMHHRKKVDAPSGTALMLGQAAALGRGVNLEEKSVRQRDGVTGERQRGDIGFATLRGGTVIGDHTVVFAGDNERIELTHLAQDRSIFANGAVKAALWGRGKAPGLYSMIDVLGLGAD